MKVDIAQLNQWLCVIAAVTNGYFAARSPTQFISIGLGFSSLLFAVAAYRINRKRKAKGGGTH